MLTKSSWCTALSCCIWRSRYAIVAVVAVIVVVVIIIVFLTSLLFVCSVCAFLPLDHTSIPYKDQAEVKGPEPEKWGHPTIVDHVVICKRPILGLPHPPPQQGP